MKKNILTILILAVTLVNVTLSAVCVFITVPSNKRLDKMIKDLNQMIALELQGETLISDANDPSKIPIADKETYSPIEPEMNIRLMMDASETKQRYIQVEVAIVLHTKAKDYKKVKEFVEKNDPIIKDIIRSTVGSYTSTTVNIPENIEAIKNEITKKINEEFNTNCILDIVFSKYLVS